MVFGGRLVPGRGRGATRMGSVTPTADAEPPTPAAPPSPQAEPAPPLGPFDVADLPDDGRQRADFGALLIPRVAGTWIRLSLDGPVPMLVATDGTSILELSVFAAPRGEGLWATIRAGLLAGAGGGPAAEETQTGEPGPRTDEPEPDLDAPEPTSAEAEADLAAQTASDAGAADDAGDAGEIEVIGPRGPELRVSIDTENGPVFARIVGVDGPRWFLCAVYTGPAAVDPSAAPELDELFAASVVVRGDLPLPVREPLALLPPDRRGEQVLEIPAQRAGSEVIRLG